MSYYKCEKCNEPYTHNYCKWCKPCYINNLKNNFTTWTSENEKIDNLIQEIQLKIDEYYDRVFEWISYNQFNDIKEINKDNFATVYSAIWKEGPLVYNVHKNVYERSQEIKITLKCLCNSQNVTEEILNKIKSYSTKRHENENNLSIYGISQNPDTKDYIIVLEDGYCENCGMQYTDVENRWCRPCQIKKIANVTSGNKKIDDLIQEMQQKIESINDTVFEWIPYDRFYNIQEIGKGGFATVYSAMCKDGLLDYDISEKEYKRCNYDSIVALKCLYNSQNVTDDFLNEVKSYSIKLDDNILKIYGISQNPDTKDYIMVTEYAQEGDLHNWFNKNYHEFDWGYKIDSLLNIIIGLKHIHQKHMVHRDFHTGNILRMHSSDGIVNAICISDMGLCGEADNIDNTKIYGVIPYVAPEVLGGKPYSQAADIYSFGMIMYFVATGRQPFDTCAHDQILTLKICNGIRPELNEPEVPKCYIELMKRCCDSNPDIRPTAMEIEESFKLFYDSCKSYKNGDEKIENQFKEAEKYRETNSQFIKDDHHPEAYYISRILNPFTKNLPKYDTIEYIDFTKLSIKDENNQLEK